MEAKELYFDAERNEAIRRNVREGKMCDLCGTFAWHALNTTSDGTRICGACAGRLLAARKREYGELA